MGTSGDVVVHHQRERHEKQTRYQHQMLSLLRSQRSVRGSVAWAGARTSPIVHAPFRLQSSATSPVSPEVWSMLQEERRLSRELQADLRAKDEDLRSLLKRKDEDLRSL